MSACRMDCRVIINENNTVIPPFEACSSNSIESKFPVAYLHLENCTRSSLGVIYMIANHPSWKLEFPRSVAFTYTEPSANNILNHDLCWGLEEYSKHRSKRLNLLFVSPAEGTAEQFGLAEGDLPREGSKMLQNFDFMFSDE